MAQSVTFVEVNIFERMLPLASGYLQAYACSDEAVRTGYRFNQHTTTVTTSLPELVSDLAGLESDVYAFSCYVWNMGLVRSALPALLATNPDAHIVLGGPQVMRCAEEYLDPSHERMMLCNGEGERTFQGVLRELMEERPDFSRVKGLSFYRDAELVTTEPEERILALDEIPSPFLTGVFGGDYRMAVLETNRGCPFRCSFCYWGAATNDRVYKFDEDRIREEVTWLSRHGVPLLYLADANWGMLKRDVGLAQHIADCKTERGVPFYVYFAAAKNSPDRVAEIATIFSGAEMLNTQPISMQSLDHDALEQVDRKNIKLSAYETLQGDLNTKGISSYIELIWPLPGETLGSFKQGIEKLCALEAAHIIAYPHMLLRNTPLSRRKDELGIVTRRVEDDLAEAELIVETADVSYEDFKQGLRFFYTVLALYNTRALRRLAPYLHSSGTMSYAALLTSFADFSAANGPSALSSFWEESIEGANYYEVVNYPTVYHIALHAARDELDAALHGWASGQPFWDDEAARCLFEVDVLTKPYLYTNTPVTPPAFTLEHVSVVEVGDRSLVVEIPDRFAPLLGPEAGAGDHPANGDGSGLFRIDHRRAQHPFREAQSREENASYCSGAVMRIADILPAWTAVNGAGG